MIEPLSPKQALARLVSLHETAFQSERGHLERFFRDRTPPPAGARAGFCYPELRVSYVQSGLQPSIARSFAKFESPGDYATTIAQPAAFGPYIEEQLGYLVGDYGAEITVAGSTQEIPYPYVLETGDELGREGISPAELALHFPIAELSAVGDEIADGTWETKPGEPRPLALFDAVRTDYSLRRLVHYTGTPWTAIQPWILLTNYHRYVDQFVRWSLEQIRTGDEYSVLHLPGGITIDRANSDVEVAALVEASPWHRFQMPGYHLVRKDGAGGITLINIGVGPSNAKNITDHLGVLRPHCWLMIGHCGGLRQSQRIGDYVLAHGYLRQDRILDALVPPDIPVPALAEVQVALQDAAQRVTGEHGDELKKRLRTGTVVTNDDRNWELRWTQERKRINLSRAIAVDMESGTIAAQGYRLRVPYGTLLCVSDKPLHGEIKLPGAANAFYDRAVGEHLMIGISAITRMRGELGQLHSRKLRSFDEPPFR
jgi:AMP nucleosidase